MEQDAGNRDMDLKMKVVDENGEISMHDVNMSQVDLH